MLTQMAVVCITCYAAVSAVMQMHAGCGMPSRRTSPTSLKPGSLSFFLFFVSLYHRWLHRQAKLLAKEKLSEKRKRMLAKLGVTLRLPKELLHQYAVLRALNGHERKLARRRFKQKRLQRLEAVLQQRQRTRQQEEHEQRRIQHEEMMREHVLLQLSSKKPLLTSQTKQHAQQHTFKAAGETKYVLEGIMYDGQQQGGAMGILEPSASAVHNQLYTASSTAVAVVPVQAPSSSSAVQQPLLHSTFTRQQGSTSQQGMHSGDQPPAIHQGAVQHASTVRQHGMSHAVPPAADLLTVHAHSNAGYAAAGPSNDTAAVHTAATAEGVRLYGHNVGRRRRRMHQTKQEQWLYTQKRAATSTDAQQSSIQPVVADQIISKNTADGTVSNQVFKEVDW